MRLHVRTKGFDLSPADEKVLLHRIERLERKLERFEPDLVHLAVDLERHENRGGEFTGNVRLVVMNRVMPAKRNVGTTASALVREAFDDLEEEVERFKAKLRREPERRRARAVGHPSPGIPLEVLAAI